MLGVVLTNMDMWFDDHLTRRRDNAYTQTPLAIPYSVLKRLNGGDCLMTAIVRGHTAGTHAREFARRNIELS